MRMQQPGAFSLHLFYPSGDGAGVCVLRKDNWNGRALSFARDRLDEALGRQELTRNGVYVLWGVEGQSVRLYIGEGDAPARLKKHASEKEFWTRAVVFVQEGTSLDKADQLYIEARLVEIARHANRCVLENGPVSDPNRMLPEEKAAAAEGFLSEMLLCLRALGIPEFDMDDEATPPQHLPTSGDGTWLELSVARNGCKMKAHGRYLDDGTFQIRRGSTGLVESVPSLATHPYAKARRRREEALDSQDVVVRGCSFELLCDLVVSSPSMAEIVLAGRGGSGLALWNPVISEVPE